jgi:N-acyl-D-amino-acid deacylase
MIRSFTLIAAALLSGAAAPLQEAEHDIVIRGGRVLDGAGNPCGLGDVAIRDGRIVHVGTVTVLGKQELDARASSTCSINSVRCGGARSAAGPGRPRAG